MPTSGGRALPNVLPKWKLRCSGLCCVEGAEDQLNSPECFKGAAGLHPGGALPACAAPALGLCSDALVLLDQMDARGVGRGLPHVLPSSKHRVSLQRNVDWIHCWRGAGQHVNLCMRSSSNDALDDSKQPLVTSAAPATASSRR